MANEFKIRKGLIVEGATGGTVVDVQGSLGQLFSVTDNLTGEIFGVADISGVPIMTINSSGASVFTGNVSISATNAANASSLNVANGNAAINGTIIGTDQTFGSPYRTFAFGNNANGNNRIFAANNTGDGMYFAAATGRGFFFRPDGGTVGNKMTMDSPGNVTFAEGVGVGTTVTTGGFNVNAGGGSYYNMSNQDSGNYKYTNPQGRLLTSNGSGWVTDGRDPILSLSSDGNSGATTVGYSIGLNLYSNTSTDDTYSPLIAFSSASNSGSFASAYAAIGGRKTGAGVDSNWSTGELHFWTAGPSGGGSAAYMQQVPAMVIDDSGNVGINASASIRFNGVTDVTHAVGYDSVIDGSFLRGQNGVRFLTGTGVGTERMRISAAGAIKFNAYDSTNNTGTPTYLLGTDASGNVVKTLTGVPGTGTTQFFNQSSEYNNSTPGIAGYGNISIDSTSSFYDTGVNVFAAIRGLVWTGKHYIATDSSAIARFYDNNFSQLPNQEANSITLPTASNGATSNHGAGWDGRYLWNLVYSPLTIIAYDLDNGTTTATIVSETDISSHASATYGIEYAEGHLYICQGGKISMFKVEGKTVTHVLTTGNILGSITAQAITYDGSYLWFTSNGQNAYKVSLDCALVATITTGLPPNNIGWAWNGQNIAAIDFTTGDVNIVNTAATRFDTEKFLMMGGKVGIGTTSPTSDLEIQSAGTADSIICLSAAGNSAYYSKIINSVDSNRGFVVETQGTDAFVIAGAGGYSGITIGNANTNLKIKPVSNNFVFAGGNVGIGTTSPQEKLHIVNAAAASVNNFMLKLQNTTTVADSRTGILFSMNNSIGSARDGFAIQGVNNGVDGQGHLTFGSVLNNTFAEKMRILSGGNVGIATTNPSATFSVANTTIINSNGTGGWGSSANYGFFTWDGGTVNAGIIKGQSGKNFHLGASNRNNDLTIKTTGDIGIGIGNASPTAKLEVFNSGGTVFNVTGSQGQLFSVTDDLSGEIFAVADISGVPIMTVNSNGISYFDGKVGINDAAPLDLLHVSAPSWAQRIQSTVDGSFLRLSANQVAAFTSGGGGSPLYFNNSSAGNILMAGGGGSVGIGVTGPQNKLHVAGSVRATSGVFFDSTSTIGFKIVNDSSNNELDLYGGALTPAISLTNAGLLKFGGYGLSGSGTPTRLLGLDGSSNVVTATSFNLRLDDTPAANTTSGSGNIVNWSVSDSVTAGNLYAVTTNGTWQTADADIESRSTYMLAIALGSNATQGMLLQGFFYKSSHGFVIGAPLYISNTAGAFSNTRPTGSGDYVRIIGYATSADYIYLDPDKTWIKLA